MISLAAVFGRRIALASALLALACQKDGDAVFDNDHLNASGAGSSGMSLGGMPGSGGDSNTAASATGGSSSDAGEGGTEAKAGSGMNEGGKAGTGVAGSAGNGQEGGSAGSGGMAGSGGTKPDPPGPVTVVISEFEDADVSACNQSDNSGTNPTFNVDGDDFCVFRSLVRPVLDQIPDGALVSEATLTLECVNVGEPVTVSYVQEAWKEGTVTWNSRPELGSNIDSFVCEELGPVTIDLTEALKAWLAGETPYGIYLHTQNQDGSDYASSEAEDAGTRPQLSVTYVLPIK